MPKKIPDILEGVFTFTGAPKKAAERKSMMANVLALLMQDPATSKLTKTEKRGITLSTKRLSLDFSSVRGIRLFFTIRGNGDDVNEVNSLFNKVAHFVNSALGEAAKGASVSTSREIESNLRESAKILQLLVDEKKIGEELKSLDTRMEPIALGLKTKNKERETTILMFAAEQESSFLIASSFKLEHGIKSNFVIEEKTILDKLENTFKQIVERITIG